MIGSTQDLCLTHRTHACKQDACSQVAECDAYAFNSGGGWARCSMYVGKLDKKAAEKVADGKLGWSYHEGGNAATAKTSSGKAGGDAGFACYGKDGESAAHRTPIYTPLFGISPYTCVRLSSCRRVLR